MSAAKESEVTRASALGWLRDLASGAESGQAGPSLLDGLEAAIQRPPEAADWPTDLLGRPCPMGAAEYHLMWLRRLLAEPDAPPAQAARRSYHARWLAHVLDPSDPSALPTVDVVIPLYNAARYAAESVESCLAQTYPAVGVIVVDDGSEDHPEEALGRFEGRIRLLRKPNGGCASARNLGVATSRADLIHFLDSDDLLEPDALARKIEALRLVPDAELCCSSYRSVGEDGYRDAGSHRAPRLGDEFCPSADLLAAAARRYPFSTITVLLPRWVVLDTGPMDEFMKNGSDARYWFRLGLRGTKVVALKSPLSLRRFHEGSLTSHGGRHQRSWAVNFLFEMHDLLERPERWPYLGILLRKMRNRSRWHLLNHAVDEELERLRIRLFERIAELGRESLVDGHSTRLPLLCVRDRVPPRGFPDAESAENEEPAGDLFRSRLLEAIDDALLRAPAVTERDLDLWLMSGTGPVPRGNRAAAHALLEWVDDGLVAGQPAIDVDTLARLSSRVPGHPWELRWKLFVALKPRLGTVVSYRISSVCSPRWIPRLRSRLRVRSRLRAARGILGDWASARSIDAKASRVRPR